MNSLTVRDLETHVPILGWILIIGHALFLVIGIFVFVLLMGVGAVSGEREAMAVLAVIATFVAALMAVLSLPGILAGYGLLKRRNWGRAVAIIVAILNLANVPLGTVLGLYGLYVLLQQSASEYFAAGDAIARIS